MAAAWSRRVSLTVAILPGQKRLGVWQNHSRVAGNEPDDGLGNLRHGGVAGRACRSSVRHRQAGREQHPPAVGFAFGERIGASLPTRLPGPGRPDFPAFRR